MALVNIAGSVQQVVRLLEGSCADRTVQVLSYKRNRCVSIRRIGEALFEVEENGYIHLCRQVTANDLERCLKKIFAREFPRSRKVRIVKLDQDQPSRHDLKRL